MRPKRKFLIGAVLFFVSIGVVLLLSMFGGKEPSMGMGDFSGRVEVELQRIGATNLPAKLKLPTARFWHIRTDEQGFVLSAYGANQAAINAEFAVIWGTPHINQAATVSGLPMSVYSARQANIALQVVDESFKTVLIGIRKQER